MTSYYETLKAYLVIGGENGIEGASGELQGIRRNGCGVTWIVFRCEWTPVVSSDTCPARTEGGKVEPNVCDLNTNKWNNIYIYIRIYVWNCVVILAVLRGNNQVCFDTASMVIIRHPYKLNGYAQKWFSEENRRNKNECVIRKNSTVQ